MTVGDRVFIRGLTLDCIVGVRPDEREQEQPIRLDLELGLDLKCAALSGRIADTADYDCVANEVRALLKFRRYRLIEMAVHELGAMLLGVHPPLRSVRLRLEKPRALEGRAAGAAVEIVRTRQDYPRRHENSRFGHVEVLNENREAGLYLLHIEPGNQIPPHRHEQMREVEWLVSGVVERNGKRLTGPSITEWSPGRIHGYLNVGEETATVFCCDSPPFIPDDEIVVRPAEVPW